METESITNPALSSRKNVGCTVLQDKYNERIFDHLSDNCTTLATGLAQLQEENLENWNTLHTGAICYVHDHRTKKYSLRLIDFDLSNAASEKWRVNLPADLEFEQHCKANQVWITFTTCDDKSYKLIFTSRNDGDLFFNTVDQLQRDRREKAAEKRTLWFRLRLKPENKTPKKQRADEKLQQESEKNEEKKEKAQILELDSRVTKESKQTISTGTNSLCVSDAEIEKLNTDSFERISLEDAKGLTAEVQSTPRCTDNVKTSVEKDTETSPADVVCADMRFVAADYSSDRRPKPRPQSPHPLIPRRKEKPPALLPKPDQFKPRTKIVSAQLPESLEEIDPIIPAVPAHGPLKVNTPGQPKGRVTGSEKEKPLGEQAVPPREMAKPAPRTSCYERSKKFNEQNRYSGCLPSSAVNRPALSQRETGDSLYVEVMRIPKPPNTAAKPQQGVKVPPLSGSGIPYTGFRYHSIADASTPAIAVADICSAAQAPDPLAISRCSIAKNSAQTAVTKGLLAPCRRSSLTKGSYVRIDYRNYQRFGVVRSVDALLAERDRDDQKTAAVEIEGSLPEGWPNAMEHLSRVDGNLLFCSSGKVALVPLSSLSSPSENNRSQPNLSDYTDITKAAEGTRRQGKKASECEIGTTVGQQMRQAAKMGYTREEFMEALRSDYRKKINVRFSTTDEMLDALSYVQKTRGSTKRVTRKASKGGIELKDEKALSNKLEDSAANDAERLMKQRMEEKTNQLNEFRSELNKVPICSICHCQRTEIVFGPCQHVVCCEFCANQLDNCPMCRQKICDRTNIYR